MAFATGVAFAQGVAFEELDTDADGMINKEEAAVHEQLSAAFDAADTDQDGNLSQDEFSAIVQQ